MLRFTIAWAMLSTPQVSSEAIEHYQQAIALKPDYTDAHYDLGYALQQQGNLQQRLSTISRRSLSILMMLRLTVT
jgi:tetratricopeptide (TPR) repeat protein